MTYFSHISTCIAKSFTAKGRTSLVQYACLTSFQWLVCLVFVVSIVMLASNDSEDAAVAIILIGLAYILVSFPTMLTATIRRFHDISYSGWSVIMLVIPVWSYFVFKDLFTAGDEAENEYGQPV